MNDDYEVKRIRERLKKGKIVIYEGEEYLTLEMAEFEYYTIHFPERVCYITEAIKLREFINHPDKNTMDYIALEKYFVEWDIIDNDANEENKCVWDNPCEVYRA